MILFEGVTGLCIRPFWLACEKRRGVKKKYLTPLFVCRIMLPGETYGEKSNPNLFI